MAFSSYKSNSLPALSFLKINYPLIKRILDGLFSFLLLLLLSPLFLLIALIIIFTSKGPLFHKSLRIGKKGKAFPCLKFRTMHLNKEDAFLKALQNPQFFEEWEQYHKLKDDPRLFPFGKFLRKYSLDELPQLFNVLKGDLSLVGPRPLTKEEFNKACGLTKNCYQEVLRIRPGITGLWQTSGRNTLSFEERITLDLLYVKDFNWKMDLIISLKTIPEILLAKGAF